jgi:hypothetical protein
MSNPDNNYTNISIANNVSSTNPYPANIQAVYDETLSQAILQEPGQYYCTMERFLVPLNNVPLFAFPVDRKQNQANVSQLQIGIENAGALKFPTFVTYVPQNDVPAPTSGGPNIRYEESLSPYYFITAIQPMIDMINTALLASHTASGVGGASPYYIYESKDRLISLIVTAGFIATGAKIFMNSYLNNYLRGFPYTTKNYNVTGAYLYYHNLATTPFGQVSPFQFRQEYEALASWMDCNRVVVTSNSLPVTPEASPNYDPNASQGTNGVITYSPIVTDFVVSYSNIDEKSTYLVLNPTPQYRLIDMNSRVPINRLNFSFWWASKKGALYPIFISPSDEVTTKIAFLKRSLYNSK